MASIDEKGITGTTLSEYYADIKARYLAINPAWNVAPESPDGLAISIWAELFTTLDEQLQLAYTSVDPRTAVDEQLDRIGDISYVFRNSGTASSAIVKFTGVNNTLIPEGSLVRNAVTNTLWATLSPAIITNGWVNVAVQCTEVGANTAAIGELTIIDSPLGGIQTVTNEASASLGEAAESDTAYRRRRFATVANPSNNGVDSMYSHLALVENVTHLKVYENATGVTDSNGMNPHSLGIFVQGGVSQDLADTIAQSKSAGVNLNEDNSYPNKELLTGTTALGNSVDVTLFRPDLIDIYIDVDLSLGVPNGLESEIKKAIIDYANASLLNDTSKFDNTGFEIGDSIYAGKLYTPVNSVVGAYGYTKDIKIGSTPSDILYESVALSFNELAVFDENNITITYST